MTLHDAITSWTIGDVTITRILESPALTLDPALLLQTTRDEVRKRSRWLVPDFATASGDILFHFQSFVIEAANKRIMVDTCIGNGKTRSRPQMHMLKTDFLARLAEAGFTRESINYVLCTHLHADHCGWNTMIVDGEWLPTFPNARYLFSEDELNHVRTGDEDADQRAIYTDSIMPILAAGLADLVKPGHFIVDGVRLEPTPGHTPGHVSVSIKSKGQEALITGDVLHHPIQVSLPHVSSHFCWDCEIATRTRREILERAARDGAFLMAAHFPGPIGVRVEPEGHAWKVVKPVPWSAMG